jgi:putative oxidoreductase
MTMENTKSFFVLSGRILLSLIFVMSGFSKISGWENTLGYMASKGMPMTQFFLFMAIVIEIAGGLSLLMGYKTRVGASLLIVFLIPATLIFHNFWTLTGMEQQMQMIMFMKNLAIIGGLLVVAGFGPGQISLDARK